jgi:hypothetical protein
MFVLFRFSFFNFQLLCYLFLFIFYFFFFFFFFFHNCVLPIQIVYVGLSKDLVCIFFVFSSCGSHVFVKNPSNKKHLHIDFNRTTPSLRPECSIPSKVFLLFME